MCCAGCEAIRRLCLKRVGYSEISFLKFYKMDKVTLQQAELYLPIDKAIVFYDKLDLRGLTQTSRAKAVMEMSADALCATIPIKFSAHVETAATGQPVYDIIIRQRMRSSGMVSIIEQCKWSADPTMGDQERLDWLDAGTLSFLKIVWIGNRTRGDPGSAAMSGMFTLTFSSHLPKVISLLYAPPHSVASIQSKPTQIVAVYVASRSLPAFQDKENHPSNVILLDHDALVRFYGPTLSGANGFQLRLAHATTTDSPATKK